MLDLFEEFGIAATWATVGFLFAASCQELESFYPAVRPEYENPVLSPYQEPLGDGEEDDPFHFAPSLIEVICKRPRQEIGTHTFSHYYCLERGQTRAAFRADLKSAVAVARKYGFLLRSIVFPRNQSNPDYAALLVEPVLFAIEVTKRVGCTKPLYAFTNHGRGCRDRERESLDESADSNE